MTLLKLFVIMNALFEAPQNYLLNPQLYFCSLCPALSFPKLEIVSSSLMSYGTFSVLFFEFLVFTICTCPCVISPATL